MADWEAEVELVQFEAVYELVPEVREVTQGCGCVMNHTCPPFPIGMD